MNGCHVFNPLKFLDTIAVLQLFDAFPLAIANISKRCVNNKCFM